jgi:hypothetical protein
MGNRDKYLLGLTLWIVREHFESVTTDNVGKMTVTLKSGRTHTVSFDSTKHMLAEYAAIQEWINEE